MDSESTYLGKRLTLLLGVLALGVALGMHLSLGLLQQAAMAAGAWPSPLATNQPMTFPLYAAAKQLQQLANISGAAGAILLLGYGLIDQADDRPLMEDQADG